MTTKKFTFLELHLGDGAVQIGSATLGADGESDIDDDANDGSCPICTAGKLLLVGVVLVLLAAVARTVLGSDEDLDELEDLEDLGSE